MIWPRAAAACSSSALLACLGRYQSVTHTVTWFECAPESLP